jgi:hypothetical protein
MKALESYAAVQRARERQKKARGMTPAPVLSQRIAEQIY